VLASGSYCACLSSFDHRAGDRNFIWDKDLGARKFFWKGSGCFGTLAAP
jgi:hypothetical protein